MNNVVRAVVQRNQRLGGIMETQQIETGTDAAAVGAQEFIERYNSIKEQQKNLAEQMKSLLGLFQAKHETDVEYPVTVEGKEKFVRLYKPEGQFIYNREVEVGIRAKAQGQIGESF